MKNQVPGVSIVVSWEIQGDRGRKTASESPERWLECHDQKKKKVTIRAANVESPLLTCAPENQQCPHWVSVSASRSPAPWPPASPHHPWTRGPELGRDRWHSLASAEQSRVGTFCDLLYYFPTTGLAPSLFRSVKRDILSLSRVNSSISDPGAHGGGCIPLEVGTENRFLLVYPNPTAWSEEGCII